MRHLLLQPRRLLLHVLEVLLQMRLGLHRPRRLGLRRLRRGRLLRRLLARLRIVRLRVGQRRLQSRDPRLSHLQSGVYLALRQRDRGVLVVGLEQLLQLALLELQPPALPLAALEGVLDGEHLVEQ